MKNLMMAAAVVLISVTTLFAQADAPYPVKDAFKQAHPTANKAMWSTEGSDYKVSYFDDAGLQHYKIYDINQQLLSHQFQLVGSDIPAKISSHYKKLKASEGNYKVWSIVDSDGKTTYKGEYNETVTNFDQNGEVQK